MIAPMRKQSRPGPRLARRVDPDQPPFSTFFERDAVREKRDRSRRWTLIVSVAVHVAAVMGLLFYSLFHVDELLSPSVEVKVFSPAKLSSGTDHQKNPGRASR
jgi:hypothetical protein